MSPLKLSGHHARDPVVDPGFARRYLLALAVAMLVIGLVLMTSADYSIGGMAVVLAAAVAGLAYVSGPPGTTTERPAPKAVAGLRSWARPRPAMSATRKLYILSAVIFTVGAVLGGREAAGRRRWRSSSRSR